MGQGDGDLVVAFALVSVPVVVGVADGDGADDCEGGEKQGMFLVFIAGLTDSLGSD